MPIDPTPFESAMPKAVRDLIADARKGKGFAAKWLNSNAPGWGQVGGCFALLRSEEPNEVVGWLVGVGMFGDDTHSIPDVVLRERHHAPVPHIIDAFIAGILAEVPTMPRQWKSIERMLDVLDTLPKALTKIIPIGLTSDRALDRGVAMRIAVRLGAPCVQAIEDALEATPPQPKAARQLRKALDQLSTSPNEKVTPQADEALLGELLSAWQKYKDEQLATLIIGIGKRLNINREPLHAKSKGELEGSWLALAAKPASADIDRLMGTPWPGAWKAALERVEALAAYPKDPRISRGLMELVPRYPSQGSSPLHTKIAALLEEIGDPQTAPAIEQTIESRFSNKNDYRAALERVSAVPTTAAPKALLEAASRFQPPDLDALWETVWKSPGDIDARLVLADGLQQVGDPRGEFIALQHAIASKSTDRKAESRAKELLEAHIDEWTGPLPAVHRASRRFENGFLTGLRTTADARKLKASLHLEQWRTVQDLTLDQGLSDANVVADLLRKMPLLKALNITRGEIEALEPLGPFKGIEVLRCSVWTPPPDRGPFPDLRALGVSWWLQVKISSLVAAARAAKLDALLLPQYLDKDFKSMVNGLVKVAQGPALTVDVPLEGDALAGWHLRVQLGDQTIGLRWLGGRRWTPPPEEAQPYLALLIRRGFLRLNVRVPPGVRVKKRLETLRATLSKQHPKAIIHLDSGPVGLLD